MDLDSEEKVDPECGAPWASLSAYQAGSSTYKLSSYGGFPLLYYSPPSLSPCSVFTSAVCTKFHQLLLAPLARVAYFTVLPS